MKKLLILLMWPLLFSGGVKITWNAPTTNSDGTPLTDLKGYNIYYGKETGVYVNQVDVGNVLTFDILNLDEGVTYFFVLTAYDSTGNESAFSTEVSIFIPIATIPDTLKPAPPESVKVILLEQ